MFIKEARATHRRMARRTPASNTQLPQCSNCHATGPVTMFCVHHKQHALLEITQMRCARMRWRTMVAAQVGILAAINTSIDYYLFPFNIVSHVRGNTISKQTQRQPRNAALMRLPRTKPRQKSSIRPSRDQRDSSLMHLDIFRRCDAPRRVTVLCVCILVGTNRFGTGRCCTQCRSQCRG